MDLDTGKIVQALRDLADGVEDGALVPGWDTVIEPTGDVEIYSRTPEDFVERARGIGADVVQRNGLGWLEAKRYVGSASVSVLLNPAHADRFDDLIKEVAA